MWGFVFLLLGSPLAARAQFGPLVSPFNAPQAKSQQELDDYLDVIASGDPGATVELVNTFTQKYPQSEFLAFTYQYQMSAYQHLNNFDGVLRAGRRALDLQPENVNALLTLASAIPDASVNPPDEGANLKQAEDYARRALHGIDTLQIPKQVTLQQWTSLRADMVAQAHEALGHIATRRGDVPLAISELEQAAYGSSTPSGRQFYRLGVAYVLAGRKEAAEKSFHRAAALGPELIRQRSLDAVRRISSPGPVAPEKLADH